MPTKSNNPKKLDSECKIEHKKDKKISEVKIIKKPKKIHVISQEKKDAMFLEAKKEYLDALYKPDRSKKGNVDEEISHVIDEINAKDFLYTTSSCAGRISLIRLPKSGRKDEAEWLFVSHALIKFEDLCGALEKAKVTIEPVWFREEAPILHICAKTIPDAQKIVNLAKMSGFKRAGIMSTKSRIMIEMTSTEFMDTIISRDNALLVDENYINILVMEANKKLTRSRAKLERFYLGLKKL